MENINTTVFALELTIHELSEEIRKLEEQYSKSHLQKDYLRMRDKVLLRAGYRKQLIYKKLQSN